MSESNPIRVFVAHVFAEYTDYLRVFEYLESRPNFFYLNCSNTGAKPAGPDSEAVKEALRRQIQLAEIVILPVALFARNPVLVTFQMDCAKGLKKPVLAIKSFGDTIAIQKSVLEKADEIVDWNDRAITDAIRRLARHEQTGQWDVIEFKLD
jgi:hypothetical protein